jgi:alkanesulfonate monooxygenase SsuD/methylene tetrahydromethanopterin reductase-like flavin-dependent oxidoreductase (luciferase family)
MITKFGSLFAGHVDLENIGFQGTPTNDRSYSNQYLATVYDKTQAIAQLMDRTGYDTFWIAEHHFQPGREQLPCSCGLGESRRGICSSLPFEWCWNWLEYYR